MLDILLPPNLYNLIISKTPEAKITEIRLRIGRNVVVKTAERAITLNCVTTQTDVEYVIGKGTKNSLYAFQDEIKSGFISYEGIRIGLSGKGVTDDNRLITIKDFSSLCLRIPHQILGVSDPINHLIENYLNTIIIAPPYAGKTTLIRDIARKLSRKKDTLIIDERGEIFASSYEFGEKLDVFVGVPKHLILEGVIRSLSPEVIVLDELFMEKDVTVVEEIVRCGIKILASAHGDSVTLLREKYPRLLSNFTYAVELCNKPKVGAIKSITRLK